MPTIYFYEACSVCGPTEIPYPVTTLREYSTGQDNKCSVCRNYETTYVVIGPKDEVFKQYGKDTGQE